MFFYGDVNVCLGTSLESGGFADGSLDVPLGYGTFLVFSVEGFPYFWVYGRWALGSLFSGEAAHDPHLSFGWFGS